MDYQKPSNYNGWYYYDLFSPGFDTDQNNIINYDDDYQENMGLFHMKRQMLINIKSN